MVLGLYRYGLGPGRQASVSGRGTMHAGASRSADEDHLNDTHASLGVRSHEQIRAVDTIQGWDPVTNLEDTPLSFPVIQAQVALRIRTRGVSGIVLDALRTSRPRCPTLLHRLARHEGDRYPHMAHRSPALGPSKRSASAKRLVAARVCEGPFPSMATSPSICLEENSFRQCCSWPLCWGHTRPQFVRGYRKEIRHTNTAYAAGRMQQPTIFASGKRLTWPSSTLYTSALGESRSQFCVPLRLWAEDRLYSAETRLVHSATLWGRFQAPTYALSGVDRWIEGSAKCAGRLIAESIT
ncbi:hypothetical protein C8Q78DRAFT_635969 [Trametes maxima]|nr:hypothetical protein C8Q78DRAFT_635969 [Trametes maxima]